MFFLENYRTGENMIVLLTLLLACGGKKQADTGSTEKSEETTDSTIYKTNEELGICYQDADEVA